jgi:protein-S-isoprenylcysteine O-methyltransferase Ste14
MAEMHATAQTTMKRGTLVRLALTRLLLGLLAIAAILFVPAGTLRYWEAWAWLAVIMFPLLAVGTYLLIKDPALLERRMHTREREKPQSLMVKLSLLWFLLAFLIPGLDHRFGWSHVPTGIVIAALVLVFLSYAMIAMVFRENSYASRVVEVAQGQKVIDTGPYAVVRHPMYLGSIILYAFSPLALGSYWAVLPMLLFIPIITVLRIPNEELVLKRELPGYAEYMQRVQFRLLPGVW